jgi:hypothetical protein
MGDEWQQVCGRSFKTRSMSIGEMLFTVGIKWIRAQGHIKRLVKHNIELTELLQSKQKEIDQLKKELEYHKLPFTPNIQTNSK